MSTIKTENDNDSNGNKDEKEKTKSSGAQYHCDYCRTDITSQVRIKCAECKVSEKK
jgi:hypothetical protein